MILQLSYYSAILFIATIVFSVLAWYVWRRRSMPGGTYFALLMADGAAWVFANAFESAAVEISSGIMFARLAFVFAVTLPPLWLLFVLDFARPDYLTARRKKVLTGVLALITVAILVINEYLGIVWHNMVPGHNGPGNTLVFDNGIVTWSITLYTYIMVILGVLLLIRRAFHGKKKSAPWIATMLVGATLVILFSAVSRYDVITTHNPDFTPVAFAVMGVIFSWGVFRQRIFELMPIASQRLIENMADGVIVLNQHGEIVRINHTAQQMLEVTQAAAGQQADKALTQWAKLAVCIDDPHGPSCEILSSGSGGERWIDVTVSSLSDEKSRPMGTLLILRDITERKLTEETLKKSEYDRVKAEHMANLGYYDWDLNKLEAQISEGCVRIFSFPAGTTSITYETFTGRIHPQDAQRIKRDISAFVKHGEAHSLEYRIIRPDGSVRHVHSESDTPVKDASGTLVRQFGVIQDITERKQAEEALALSEARYKTMVETANEGICIIDREDRLVFINHKVTEMTGFTPEEALGHTAYEFVDSQYHDSLQKNLFSKRLGVREQFDYLLHCKDGGTIWVIASASPICNDRGEFMGTLAMLTNITGRKLADEQLKTSLKEKEVLLKEVHHRVKNNLQIITSLLNLQSSGIEDPRYGDMIRDSQNRIKSMALVHELLYRSKDLSNISISEYLQSLTGNVSRSYSRASGNVRLRTEIEDISMDVDRAVPIGIIVTELVSNAYKYAFPEGRAGEIWVELRRNEGKMVLDISDNGVGLPAGFDIQKTNTLGLQLVEMLAQQIDGTLEVEKGERTVFRISLKG